MLSSGAISIDKNTDVSGWTEEQYLLPAGLNELRWTFTRSDDELNQGAVCLDNVRFEEVTHADLAIASVDYSSGSYALERDAFPLTINVVNRGSSIAEFDYNDLDLEVRLGNTQNFDQATQLIGHLAVVDALDQGQRFIFQGDLDLPVNLEEGSYYLLLRVKSLDPDFNEFTYNDEVELLENNDSEPVEQNVTIQHLPELVVRTTAVENEKLFYPKEIIRFDWELENVGLGDVPYGTELTQSVELWMLEWMKHFLA